MLLRIIIICNYIGAFILSNKSTGGGIMRFEDGVIGTVCGAAFLLLLLVGGHERDSSACHGARGETAGGAHCVAVLADEENGNTKPLPR